MSEFYIKVPKTMENTSNNGNLSLEYFGSTEVKTGMFGNAITNQSLMDFYYDKPNYTEANAKNYHMLRVSVEDHENGRTGLLRNGTFSNRGRVAVNLDIVAKPSEEPPLVIKVEAQVLTSGKEISKASIMGEMEKDVSAKLDKESKSKTHPALRAASNIKHRIISKDKSLDTHEDTPRRKM